MIATETFSTIRVPQQTRKKLKQLAAQADVPMYVLIEAWLDTVCPPTDDESPPTDDESEEP